MIPGHLPTWSQRRWDHWTVIAAVALLLPAYVRGILALSGLQWPHDVDLLRDIGAAQSILDGHFGQDPLYLGEVAWYPPLLSLLIAGLSWITGAPVMVTAAQMGIHFNLLPAIAFFALMWKVFGRGAALAGLIGYLYLVGGGLPMWCEVGLSPYFFALDLMHGAFSLGLLCAVKLLHPRAPRALWSVAGLLVGITFLGHPSTAMLLTIILASMAAVAVLDAFRKRAHIVPALVNAALFLLPAAIGAWVLLAPLIKAYGLHTRNPHSSTWPFEPLLLNNVLQTLGAVPLPSLLLAIVGLVSLLGRKDRTAALVLFTFCLVLAFFLWSTVSSALAHTYGRIVIPSFVPAYHFYFYIKLLMCVFFGIAPGVVLRYLLPGWSMERMIQAFPGRYAVVVSTFRRRRWMMWTGWTLSLLVLALTARPLANILADKLAAHRQGVARNQHPHYAQAYAFILANTAPNSVFLADDRSAMDLISHAGRKLVATNPYFSNPYVDLVPRDADRDTLYSCLEDGRTSTFRQIASRYHLTHVILKKRPSAPISELLVPVFEQPGLVIARLYP